MSTTARAPSHPRATTGTRADAPSGVVARWRHPGWLPAWSTPAAMRAVRATVVVPGLFALTYLVVGDLQMATFAAFGGFATLVLAGFGGGRRDKLLAHLGLAVVGSVLVVIGTAVNSSVLLACVVTVPVTFAVSFGGVAGPNAASGATAALLAYVLPAASPGTMDMLPSRLAGWWLAAVAGTAAVVVFSPRSPGAALRSAAADTASALAAQLGAALAGDTAGSYREASLAAERALQAAFTATPYRPTGLAAADQALHSLVGLLEWCTSVICDSLREYRDLRHVDPVERRLLADTGATLRDIAAVLRGEPGRPGLDCLERSLAASVTHLRERDSGSDGYAEAVHLSFHARTTGMAVRTALADAVVAARRSGPEIAGAAGRRGGVAAAAGVVSRHASLRSVWFRNSARGAVALAAAVAVADLSGVQHGFWVVLGTLSVLRTNAAATGATALRALAGTAVGFVVGGVLLFGIGTGPVALWTALPVAVLVATYAPGVLSFTAGQAAFTLVVSVLFNLLAPAGWRIGVVRIEDVAIGSAVSLVVGVLFWPRGAGSLVADDLADALRTAGVYLADAASWALGLRDSVPAETAAIDASARLEDASRGFLAEQGAKRVPKEDLWRLVGGATRARLTAHSLAGLPSPGECADPLRAMLGEQAAQVAAWYDHLASRLDRADHGAVPVLAPPRFRDPLEREGVRVTDLTTALWVGEHLKHLMPRLAELVEPARVVAAQRHAPWWR